METELSIPLTVNENGYWRDKENTIAIFEGFSNIPLVFQSYIDQIDPQKHKVVSKQSIKAPTIEGLLSFYRLTNEIANQTICRAELINAITQYSNPDMYLINDGVSLLVEHDGGYVIVGSVQVSGDPFWMIEGEIENVKNGAWILNESRV